MKKRYFTLKNGAFYPRIQSISALFLMIFLMIKINLFYERRRENKLWEKKLCDLKVGVCFTTCSRCCVRVVARRDRPATSCRAFLLRTLPPPPKILMCKKSEYCKRKWDDPIHTSNILICTLKSYGGWDVPVRVVTCSTWRRRAPPTPHPPKEFKGPNSVKMLKNKKSYKILGGGGA